MTRQRSTVPFEIASLAVNDEHVEVREWIALNGKWLDYSERHYGKGDDSSLGIDLKSVEFPERNLVEQLKNDPDPFVRARLRENPTAFHRFEVLEEFQTATHIERLAIVRNPNMWESCDLLTKLFDYENKDLPITLQDRKELIGAFLSNHEALAHLKEWKEFGKNQNFTSTLWELASKWPKSPESEVRRTSRPILMPHHAYFYVPVDDGMKATIYRREPDQLCRLWILQSCCPEDVQTLGLGKKDKDKECRELARETSKMPHPSDEEYNAKWKQEMEEKAKNRQDVTKFLTWLGIALIVVKLYFPDWSNFALSMGLSYVGAIVAIFVLGRVIPNFQKERERKKVIAKIFLDDKLEKARDLLEKGLSPFIVSKETGLSLKILKREGIVG